MRFDATISLGTLLHMFALLLAALAIYTRLDRRLTRLETKLDILFGWWKKRVASNGGDDAEFFSNQ